jgi:hypothetical protein
MAGYIQEAVVINKSIKNIKNGMSIMMIVRYMNH